jgi:hypothetical protein
VPRLLFSARDPGAAGHVGEVARHALSSGGLDVRFVAQPPAYGLWTDAGLEVQAVAAAPVSSFASAGELLAEARSILARLQPDAVVTGLSGPDAGIDEALHQVSSAPVFAIQDFWGDVNLVLPRRPDGFFVVDEEAERLTRKRVSGEVFVSGAPKHARLGHIDVIAERHRARALLGELRPVFGLFLQPLKHLPDYMASMRASIAAVARISPSSVCLVRAHPKAPHDAGAMVAFAHALGLRAQDVSTWPLERALLACEVVLTATSTIVTDVLAMARMSGEPAPGIVHVLADSVRDELRTYGELDRLPILAMDLAEEATNSAESIIAALLQALDPKRRIDIAARLPSVILDGRHAPQFILDRVLAAVEMRALRA